MNRSTLALAGIRAGGPSAEGSVATTVIGVIALAAVAAVVAIVLTRGNGEPAGGGATTNGSGGTTNSGGGGGTGTGPLLATSAPLGGADGATFGALSPSWAHQNVLYVEGGDQVKRPIESLDSDAPDAVGTTLVQSGTNDYPIRSVRGEIAFQHIDRGRGWGIYVVPRGNGEAIPIVDDDEDQVTPSWSPDGREIVYSSLADSFTFDLQVVDREDGEYTLLQLPGQDDWNEFFPVWSPTEPGWRSFECRPACRNVREATSGSPTMTRHCGPVPTFNPSSRTSETFVTRAGRQTVG